MLPEIMHDFKLNRLYGLKNFLSEICQKLKMYRDICVRDIPHLDSCSPEQVATVSIE